MKIERRPAPESQWVQWARRIIQYYNSRRGVGSTWYQERGWLSGHKGRRHPPIIVLASLSDEARVPAIGAGCSVVTLGDSPDWIAGMDGPLVVEHRALMRLLAGLLSELEIAKGQRLVALRPGKNTLAAAVGDLVEATAARWAAGEDIDPAFVRSLGRAQAIVGLPRAQGEDAEDRP